MSAMVVVMVVQDGRGLVMVMMALVTEAAVATSCDGCDDQNTNHDNNRNQPTVHSTISSTGTTRDDPPTDTTQLDHIRAVESRSAPTSYVRQYHTANFISHSKLANKEQGEDNEKGSC
eukprot:Phypoly_transcript_27139.p2 GENE.Phypoly_transcript_27139~~Phypoly_transcript_27139.p2  ORF type:complete len:118 (-),score=20.81 Phypoly_transcript_27139:59-412(-)